MVKKEVIVNRNLETIGHELLYKKPNNEYEDYRIFRMLKKFAEKSEKKCFINIYPKTIIRFPQEFINLPENLCLELIEEPVQTKTLRWLIKKYGIRIVIDDFGSGYSNIDRILDIPVRAVKFDRVLWKNFPKASLHFIEEFKSRNIKTIAEKVEDWVEFNLCYALGFDFFQGYYFRGKKHGKRRALPCNR